MPNLGGSKYGFQGSDGGATLQEIILIFMGMKPTKKEGRWFGRKVIDTETEKVFW